jgi:hypothetical protein
LPVCVHVCVCACACLHFVCLKSKELDPVQISCAHFFIRYAGVICVRVCVCTCICTRLCVHFCQCAHGSTKKPR